MWNPNLHAALWDVREALTTQLDTEHLEWNYTHLPYALTTVNFGKQTVCDTHMDDKDFAFMQSVLKCFGSFDYRKGGHLLFPSLKLAVQFPQGAEAYFPTARLPHANTRIGPSEKRYSITSYSSGGHFEWAYRGGLHKYGWQEYLRTHELEEAEDARDAERPALLTERFFPIWH
ncbi:hypothetical protein CYLTODRAFT_125385 [Cylindrobasidium torrendii FP15055 ss-10]|uniref:Uncharacterized protein n=1 Tax=Cylindrobasidium torrendii FP15055 ss-10 TaxID=1314674 RepID=A0A0D7AZX8_9AGAR|nr:hypothetical protein CYLTODRAFT_125385 [Cylindrobasidium torrendii FP15055 ss-10]